MLILRDPKEAVLTDKSVDCPGKGLSTHFQASEPDLTYLQC